MKNVAQRHILLRWLILWVENKMSKRRLYEYKNFLEELNSA